MFTTKKARAAQLAEQMERAAEVRALIDKRARRDAREATRFRVVFALAVTVAVVAPIALLGGVLLHNQHRTDLLATACASQLTAAEQATLRSTHPSTPLVLDRDGEELIAVRVLLADGEALAIGGEVLCSVEG